MARGLIMRGRSHSLPVINVPTTTRTVELRRNALGNIFQGQKPREITKFMTGKKVFLRSMSTCATVDSLTPVGHSVRFNLTSGDFEIRDELFDHAEDESLTVGYDCQTFGGDYPESMEREVNLDTTLSDKTKINSSSMNTDQTARRLALADIFANVEQDMLLELLAVYSGAAVNENRLYKSVRRNALGNVYADISASDLNMFLTGFEGEIHGCTLVDENSHSSSDASDDEMAEQTITYSRSRRQAMGNIFDGCDRDAIVSIAGEIDEIEEEAKTFDYQNRRMALPNIKNIVEKSDISRLRDMHAESEIENVNRCRERRPALANIYSGLDSEELNSFLGQFSENVDSEETE